MKKGLITSILALTFSGLQAQPLPASPKLVVTLTIDQLRTDYMEAFSSLYGEKGFKRLLREGKVFRQAEFPFCGTDRASAIAAIYTGTTPSMNGIIAEQWLDAGTLRPINCVEDPNFMGNYTDESTSPSQLLTSTIADELKIATRNKGLVYAIAPFRDAAILGAGHAEVNLLTEELLNKSTIGQDDVPDLLSLTYYAGNYNHRSTQECAMEMQDTYVRLDRSIASLLELIERKVGLHNVLFCITSTGYADPEAADPGVYRIPGGEFYLNRCAALLNMYLMASYGEGQYVEAYYDQQIYLNHKLIENKQLSLTEIQEKSAEFLVQFSGVSEVYSAHRLLLGPWSPQIERIRNSFHRKRSGDLLIEILPGWTIMQENSTDNRVVRTADIPAPLILLGGGMKAETIRTPISIDRIAPTLASVMRIRAPNASTASPLDF